MVRYTRTEAEQSMDGMAHRDMINPDHIGVVECDRIASPDVLGVEVRDGHIPG
jgi:hypothetical protein